MKHIYTLLLGLLAWSASMAQEGVNIRRSFKTGEKRK